MFFWQKKEKVSSKAQNRIKFQNVDRIVLQRDRIHLELDTKTGILTYKNVVSPADMALSFPVGYFDERIAAVPPDSMEHISCIFDRLFQSRQPERSLAPLPPGARMDAYMRIQSKGRTFYYTNTHANESGFQIKVEPVAEEFVMLLQLLKQYCNFPQWIPVGKPIKFPSEVLEHLNNYRISNKSSKVIGYRYATTGVFGYDFYTGSEKLCSMSSIVAPSSSVMMFGFGKEWKSEFENCTIFPGLARYIDDCRAGKRIGKIVYIGTGKYEINDSIYVYCNTEQYAFFDGDQLIARINRTAEKPDFVPFSAEYDIEPYFDVFIQNGIGESLLMLILSFPMLQFAFS